MEFIVIYYTNMTMDIESVEKTNTNCNNNTNSK